MKNVLYYFIVACFLMLTACSGSTTTKKLDINVYGIDQQKFVVKKKADNLHTGKEFEVNGQTYYLLTGIDATPGQSITLTLHTISKIPAVAMSHNWVLLQLAADAKAFVMQSNAAKDTDYIAPELKDEVITETGLVGGGESASTTFSAPEVTGDYDYLCTFPGHYIGGMKGTLSVQKKGK